MISIIGGQVNVEIIILNMGKVKIFGLLNYGYAIRFRDIIIQRTFFLIIILI